MQLPKRWTRGLKERRDRLKRVLRRQLRRAKRLGVRVAAWGLLALLVWLALASSCTSPPENPEDLCAIFREKRSWYRATKRSFEDWGVPQAVQMAILYQESGFRARVRPPRKWYLWILPGPRPSSAYGYGQVLESTWASYQKSTGRLRARRDDFSDVADFVGWYGERIHRVTGVAKDDALGLYLAYHEGPQGYLRGTHHRKGWLADTARRVETRALRYQRQYDGCRKRLEKWWIFW